MNIDVNINWPFYRTWVLVTRAGRRPQLVIKFKVMNLMLVIKLKVVSLMLVVTSSANGLANSRLEMHSTCRGTRHQAPEAASGLFEILIV